MANQMSLQRKRVVVLGGSVASMSAASPLLAKGHPYLFAVFMALLGAALVFLIAEFIKLRRSGE